MKRKSFAVVAMAGVLAATMSTGVIQIHAENGQPPAGNNGGTPPEKPDGNGNGGTPPDGGGGADTMTYDYSGTMSGKKTADGKEVTSDGEIIDSDTTDQNAALSENGGTLKITNGTLSKSGDDTNGDNCNFYGINSISLTAGEKSKSEISDSRLTADSEGSNGIFATDSGTVYADNDTITTAKGNSRGLDATYSGTIIANQMNISTKGDHSASIATDRGGGDISVTNSTLKTEGSGSPLLYSTGNIQVDHVSGTSSGSQIAGMEGLNTILIYNSELTSTQKDKTASDPVADGVIIYQSTSGDAESTTGEAATFQVSNSKLKSAITSGSMFYVTNTKANIVLSNTTLDFDSDKADLLLVQGNDANNWGTAGSNGAKVKFTGLKETLKGNITADTISSADVYLLDGTTWTGAASIEENSVNTSLTDAPLTVNVSNDSTWVVTSDSTVTNLNVEDGGKVVDSDGKTVSIVVNGETKVKGDSDLTVTVKGTYGTSFETSDDNKLSSDYIDRTDFDQTYSTSTSFGTNGDSASTETANQKTSVSSDKNDASSDHTAQYIGAAIGIVIVAGVIVFLIRRKKK